MANTKQKKLNKPNTNKKGKLIGVALNDAKKGQVVDVVLSAVEERIVRDKERFLKELADEKVSGNVTVACRRTTIGRTTAYGWKAADEEFSKKWDSIIIEAAETFSEEAEFALRSQVIKGNVAAIIFTLKNLKPKKWKDKQEHGGKIETTHKVSPRFAKVLQKLLND